MHAAFVELRQEVGAHVGVSCQPQKPTSIQVSEQQQAGMPHAEADEKAGHPLQAAEQQAVAVAMRGLRLRQQVVRQHRRDGQRHDERRQDRHDVGDAQRRKQPTLDAGQGEQRHERQDHDRRAEHDGGANFAAGFVDDQEGRLRVRQRVVFREPPKDVLDVHDGVVHQFAHRHGDPAERHHVDREVGAGDGADQPEHQRRDHERQRDGRERDERRAEVEQEQKQDDDDQHGPDDEGLFDVVNAAVDEVLELEQVGVDDDVGGQRRFGLAERRLHLVGELSRVGVRLLDDRDDDAGIAVDAGVAALRGRAFLERWPRA